MMSLVEQELCTFPNNLSSHPVLSGLRLAQSLLLCVLFMLYLCSIIAIVLSDLLGFTDFNCSFDTFQLLLEIIHSNPPSKESQLYAAAAYGVYISQLIRYSRSCGSHRDFLDRRLLLTRKLLNQGFLLDKLK